MIARRALLAGAAALWPAAHAKAADPLPDTVARVRRAVLPVGTWRETDNPRFGFRGSGFAVADGTLVATCAHVLPEDAGLPSGPRLVALAGTFDRRAEVRPVRVLAVDRVRDLALLRVEGAPLEALPLAAADAPAREGQAIALTGYPVGGALGFTPVTHRGIVAAVTAMAQPAPTAGQLDPRAVARLREGNFDVLQLDATAYPGNSGGPVYDAATGEVLGVLSMGLVKGSRESALSQPTGISYAVPVRHLRALLAGATAPPAATLQTR